MYNLWINGFLAPPSGFPKWAIAIIVLSILLLIVGIVIFVFCKRRRGNRTRKVVGTTEYVNPVNEILEDQEKGRLRGLVGDYSLMLMLKSPLSNSY